jgi:hypothetical protein
MKFIKSYQLHTVLLLTVLSFFLSGNYLQCGPDPVDVLCSSNSDCAEGEYCELSSNSCVAEGIRCQNMGGTCHHYLDQCPGDTFIWTGVDCPLGRSGMCCLPYDTCQGLEGYCVPSYEECSQDYSKAEALDGLHECGQSSDCCIPTI